MKNLLKYLGISLSLIMLMMACQKHQGTGSMTVKMKDAPIEFDSVFVEVLNVQVHYSDNPSGNAGWIDLQTNVGIYNLLELQNDVTAVLVNNNELPVGSITQMRVILGYDNSVVIDSLTYPLELSSQDKTGIKLNLGCSISQGDLVEVVIDFDAAESIVVEGQQVFKLKPVIKVESVNYL